jgi:nucleoside triphosphatase
MLLMHTTNAPLRCVIHGSFRRHFDRIQDAHRAFTAAGIEVLAPQLGPIADIDEGFALFADEIGQDPRLIELRYLHHVKRLGRNGFSYFVNTDGYIGKSASYELGIAQLTNTPCFFAERLDDHPAYIPHNSVWSPETLAAYVAEHGTLPEPQMHPDEAEIHRLFEDLMVPGSVIAVGGIIERERRNGETEVLLVKTHKWGDRFCIVGGKVRRNERLDEALLREVREETGLRGRVGQHLATFDQIKNSGYYLPGVQHVFVDNVVRVDSRRVRLNEEAQEYVWLPAREALRDLDIEPNARHTLELYAR